MDVSEILDGLNEPQRQAVQHVNGPLLVLAGAGSGKTRVITRRVAHLVSQGIPPWQILAITFTNKSAEEMRLRVEQTGIPRGATVCTFHALCARLLREFADLAGLDSNYSIYDRDDQIKIVKQAMAGLNLKSSYLTPGGIHSTIGNAKNELQTPQAFAGKATTPYQRDAAAVYTKYEQLLAKNNAVDFDDLLLRMAFLLRDRQDVRELLGRRYQYVLIDEYQDTNHAQYVLAHGIALDHQNLCATGDPDQSIYGWRGADINNILDFEKDYPSATVVRLEENYRSVQPILTAASTLIAHNTQRKNKRLFTNRQGGDDVRIVTLDDERAEAKYIADKIEQFRIDGGRYGEVAVFYRVNALSRVLEEALLTKGIPYAIARGVEFYNRKEIKDVLAFLKLLVNPADDLSCLRVINVPPRGIGKTTIERLQAAATMRGWSMVEAAQQASELGLKPAATKKLTAFGEMITEMVAELTGDPESDTPPATVQSILETVYTRTGLEEAYNKEDEDARQVQSNIGELITTAAEFAERNPTGTLNDYLHQIALVSATDHMEGSTGAVTLMTLHAAKGLEFPVVFMAGCEEGMLPFQRAQEMYQEMDPTKMEEERRLMFVGITRAEQRLTMTTTKRRMVRGRTESRTASPFLNELGSDSVVRDDRTSRMDTSSRAGRRSGFYGGRNSSDSDAPDIDVFEKANEEHPTPPEYEYLRTGCLVQHGKFGLGKVVKLSGQWPNTRATVLFQDYGQKVLSLAHTTLELADAPF